MSKSQREFLRECAASGLPITFTDGAATHSVYLSRLRLSSPHKTDAEEQEAELVLVEAEAEDWGTPTGWRDQLEFLNDAMNDALPAEYVDVQGNRRHGYITTLRMQVPFRGPKGLEPVVQFTFLELWREWIGLAQYGHAVYGTDTYA